MLLLSRFKISGHSMEPTISHGQTVLISSIPYLFSRPKVGDIVVFKIGEKVFIKRITRVNPSADGEKYFVKGDNRDDSMDSKDFGWIRKREVVGKVIYEFC